MKHITWLTSYIETEKKDKSGNSLCKLKEAGSITFKMDQVGPTSSVERKKKVKDKEKECEENKKAMCR